MSSGVERQITYWRESAKEDLGVGSDLITRRKPRHGLFFVHLALEKSLKAIVCRTTGTTPPKIHNLVRLAQLAQLEPSPPQLDTLAQMNAFNVEGRYSDMLQLPPTSKEASEYLSRAEEVFQWLINR
jgi:HEPN domain-containing protein